MIFTGIVVVKLSWSRIGTAILTRSRYFFPDRESELQF